MINVKFMQIMIDGWPDKNLVECKEKIFVRMGQSLHDLQSEHNDVIKWKNFLHYWPFMRGIHDEFPAQRPVTLSFDAFFDLGLNEQLSKQSWGWWFKMPSCPLWHHSNENSKSTTGTEKLVQPVQNQ